MTSFQKPQVESVTEVHSRKLNRIRSGSNIRTLDIFAGCGGISLGFHKAGFDIIAGVEIDKHAARTHASNFHSGIDEHIFEKYAQPRDITKTEPKELLEDLSINTPVEDSIDVLVGGPPCQAFARVGRSKLREVYEHPEAFLQDPRSNLYMRYLDYVRELKPVAIMMENVPDVLNFGGHNIAEEVCETLEDLGYDANYTLLNAVHYGVPEMRERMFLIAYSKQLGKEIKFPPPTHSMELPRGYHGSRQVALKTISDDLFSEVDHHFISAPESADELKPAVTAEEALGDLPVIPEDHRCKLKKAPQRFNQLDPYPLTGPLNTYATLMRESWTGFTNSDGVFDHLIRYLPRDYKIFKRMSPGDQYPEAHTLSLKMFEEALAEKISSGSEVKEGSEDYDQLKKDFVPPYDPTKFPNKWRKMEPDQPARTLMAHLGKDSYSHIHYDSSQARTISIREAARLQSFPDGFKFSGSMNPAFKQIGNAVPPLMSNALAREIFNALKE